MNIFKKLIHRFKAPTPEKWQKIGNVLFAIGTGVSIPAQLADCKTLGLIIFLIGLIGRGIVEFTTEKNDN
jgi:hypothetical protein